MINKFYINLALFFFIILNQNTFANEVDIKALKIEIDRENQIVYAAGNVNISDAQNNLIISEKAEYDKINGKISIFGKSEIVTSEKFKVESENIFYDRRKGVISSEYETKIIDRNGNQIFVDMFNYIVEKNMFFSKGKIKILDKKNNEYLFSEIYIDEKKRKIVGSDIKAFLNDESFKYDKRNEPKFFANSATLGAEETKFNKGVFTICQKRENEKCSPWVIRANEITHNSAKKTIYYDNAILKIYDFPVFYFPRFFHPDPSVKRQSGFLLPKFADNTNVGFGTTVPYYWSISSDRDMTITPKIYTNENVLVLNEYRQAFKNSFLIVDSSFTKGYKEAKVNKTSGSRSHIFSKFNYNFLDEKNSFSDLEINLQHVSNDTYLKVHDIQTELVDNEQSILTNEIKYQFQNDREYFGLIASAFENLSVADNSKYEYVLPNIIFERNLISGEKFGILDLHTNAIGKNYKVNQTTKFLVNDLSWQSNLIVNSNGIQTGLEGLLKLVTYDAENTEDYKSEDFNAEANAALAFNMSLPMVKENSNLQKINFLTPKLSLRFAPGHMRDIDDDNLRLSYSNLFNLNKNSQMDVLENGLNATLGVELSSLDFNNKITGDERYSLYVGQVYSLEENFDMPARSSLDQQASDIVGRSSVKLNDNFLLKNEFMLDHNLNDINYNDLNASLIMGNASFNLGFLEENNHVGSNSYVRSDIKLELNDSNNLSFDLKKNLETDSTEFYNLAYNYINDCLKAGLVYRREFYTDRDIESSDTLMFNVSIFPFGQASLPSVER